MNKKPLKICFLADRHGLYDDRIYWKEALSLQQNGFEVHYLLISDKNESGVTKEGIHYQLLKRKIYHKNRLLNFLLRNITPGSIYDELFHLAAQLKAEAYHIHDLRVNCIGKKLKNLGHRPAVVYDVHEPYPENVIDYYTGPSIFKSFVRQYSKYIRLWEKNAAKSYDLIITTEENMQRRFKSYFPEKPVEIIYNYTNLPANKKSDISEKEYGGIYTGGITERRGAIKILQALCIVCTEHPDFKMLFLGSWFPGSLKSKMAEFISAHGLDNNVVMHDAVPYNEVNKFYHKSRIGLGIFLPIPTHRIILQIKIFEYMNFGLPIVGSNFGHISEIIEKHDCGLTIDPESPESIAAALKKLLNDFDFYERMSENSRQAVQLHYRWEKMEQKLVDMYQKLLEE